MVGDLSWIPRLRTLRLFTLASSAAITDLEPLARMPGLEAIDLLWCPEADLKTLASADNLTCLRLAPESQEGLKRAFQRARTQCHEAMIQALREGIEGGEAGGVRSMLDERESEAVKLLREASDALAGMARSPIERSYAVDLVDQIRLLEARRLLSLMK